MTVADNMELNEDLWGHRKRLGFVVDSIESIFPGQPPPDINILDVGCGTAALLGMPLIKLGYRVTGIDLHGPSIEKARHNSEGWPNATFICGPVDEIDGPFDVVILSEVLEHVPKPKTLFASGLERLRAEGLMIITVPNGYGEFEWDSWLFRGAGLERLVNMYIQRKGGNGTTVVSTTENQEDRHIQFFTLKRLYFMFATAGLKPIRQQGSTLLSGPLAGHLLARSTAFLEWNARTADRLPMEMSSGWYFALQRSETTG